MKRETRVSLLALAVLAVAVAGGIGWWSVQGRWRPHTLKKHTAEIAQAIEDAGWVSPGLKGPALYMVSFRSCPDCIRFEREQFPALHAAGVDTRVIMVARRSKSTPAERSGVAELWANRSWKTFENWMAIPIDAWTASGLPDADTTPERAALVEQGRVLADKLGPWLKANHVSEALHYPTLIWKDAKGRWRSCNCENPATYRFVRKELGVTG
jgi:hypothetical protein